MPNDDTAKLAENTSGVRLSRHIGLSRYLRLIKIDIIENFYLDNLAY